MKFRSCVFPSESTAVISFGTTANAHLVPVKPAFFEKLLNSIATSFAPSIS